MINLQKGNGINLRKEDGSAFKTCTIGMSWKNGKKIFAKKEVVEEVKGKEPGFFGKLLGKTAKTERNVRVVEDRDNFTYDNKTIDLDTSILFYKDGVEVDKCYFGKEDVYFRSKQVTHHAGDDTTGTDRKTKLDNEQIKFYLSNLDSADCDVAYVVINAYSTDVNFGQVRDAACTIYDENGKEYAKYNLTDDYSNSTGVIIGKFVPEGNGWRFVAIGQGCPEAHRLSNFAHYIRGLK